MAVGRIPDGPGAHDRDVPALVLAAQRGDRSAFGELYRRYRSMVYSIAVATITPDEVADVAQEAQRARARSASGTRSRAIAASAVSGDVADAAGRGTVEPEIARRKGRPPHLCA